MMCGSTVCGLRFFQALARGVLPWLMLVAVAQANGEFIFQRFGVQNGLSQVSILSLAEDRDGFLWVGTEDGLNRFNGDHFESYFHQSDKSNGLASSFIFAVLPLPDGNVLVVNGGGIDLFHPAARTVTPLLNKNQAQAEFPMGAVSSYALQDNGDVWLGDELGLIRYRHTTKQLQRIGVWKESSRPSWAQMVSALSINTSQQLYVATMGGLRVYDLASDAFLPELPGWLISEPLKQQITVMNKGGDGELLWATRTTLFSVRPQQQALIAEKISDIGVSDSPQGLLRDVDGGLWITTGRGLFYREAGTRNTQQFLKRNELTDTLPDNLLTRILQDRAGNIWVGSYTSGLARINKNGLRVRYFLPASTANHNISSSASKLAALDADHVVMATYDGWLSVVNVRTQSVQPFSAVAGVEQSARPQPFVAGISVDAEQHVWLASYNGIYRQARQQKPKLYLAQRDAGKVYSDMWSDTLRDEQQRMWFLNPYTGLHRWDPKTDRIMPVPISNLGLVNHSANLFRFVRDPEQGFWIFSASNQLYFWSEDVSAAKVISLRCHAVERVFDAKRRADGKLWLASNLGPLLFDPVSHDCEQLNSTWSLPTAVANAIEDDALGNLWVSTNRGIAHYDLRRQQFRLYGANDGFHAGEFNAFSSLKLHDQLLFGAIRGLAMFDPLQMRWQAESPATLISDVRVNGAHDWLADRRVMRDLQTPITLNHASIQLSIGFDADNLSATSEYEFRYRLEGEQEEPWLQTAAPNRVATFTQLPAANYEFVVQARRPGGIWGPVTRLPIAVLPQWWESWWAKTLYGLVVVLVITLSWRWRTIYLRRRNEVLSRAVKQRTDEIENLLKQRTRLFANVSHELRTPLTLITGPLSDLMGEPLPDKVRKKLFLIQQNSRRLHDLIDQVLALTRLQDERAAPLRKQAIALKPHLLALLESYDVIAKRGQISLTWGPVDDIDVLATSDLPEVVFGNLISNAIKYTNPGGQIHISLVYDEQLSAAEFVVRDTGIGMTDDEMSHIFEPFYRAQHEERSNALLPHSSGLGLPHVKELLAQHDGTINVSSRVGEGSLFRVTMPSLSAPDSVRELNDEVDIGRDTHRDRATVLIVEDNASLNDYLKSLLSEQYHCLSASNGADAESLAYEHLPDLIISDIRMPELDGLELAQRLKNDLRTSHIPIIVVTAIAESEIKLSALTLQVDDVISKPFDVPELKIKVRNLIQRTRAHALPASATTDPQEPLLPPTALPLTPVDQRFMTQLEKVVSDNLANADFELEDISRQLYLSKKQLQRKIKALTGLSPMEFLRHRRIAEACVLLQQGRTITDVCYSVGFSSQSYFSTCFKQQMGDTPKNWQHEHLPLSPKQGQR